VPQMPKSGPPPSTRPQSGRLRGRTRGLIALLLGVVAVVLLAAWISQLRPRPAWLSAFGAEFVLELLVGFVVAVVFFVGSALLGHKVKAVSELIGQRTCDKCSGGTIECPACRGLGIRPIEVDVLIECPNCRGVGRVSQPCPRCGGSRTIARQATFTPIGPNSVVKYMLKWRGTGHWQHVTVGVANTDALTASFTLSVAVPGSGTPPQTQTVTLGSGGSTTLTFEFDVHGSVAYPVVFNVAPGTISVTCPSCAGGGTVQVSCPVCKEAGKISKMETRDAPCTNCGGTKRAACPDCKGTGKVPRVP
jgi:DnaJ-class molecular chaperone